MKGLNLQFKRWLHTNYSAPKFKSKKQWIVPFLAIGAIASCAVTDSPQKSIESSPITSFTNAIKSLAGFKSEVSIKSKSSELPLLTFSQAICSSNSKEEQKLNFSLATFSQAQDVQLSLVNKDNKLDAVDVKLNGDSLGYISAESADGILTEASNLCAEGKSSFEYLEGERIIVELAKLLTTISPHCEYKTLKNQFVCLSDVKDTKSIAWKLKQINKDILKKVKRPPYILMRKLSMARQIGDAINHKLELSQLCSISKYSLPEETPTVLKTKEWQQGVCLKPDSPLTPHQVSEAYRLAYEEIAILKDFVIKEAARGIVSIRLPKTTTNGARTLFVELSPNDGVRAHIKDRLIKHQLPKKVSLCIHPYGNDSSLAGQQLYALGIIKTSEATCMHNPVAFSTGVEEIISSITGDARFVVSNYRGKLIRLPKGNYDYEISVIPKDPRAAPINSGNIIQTGTISWSGKRYTTIR